MSRLILFNKPYGVLSQFTDKGTTAPADGPRATLSDYIDVPGVYPAGRLDRDSEGLLILTDDGALQARISSPKHKMPKTYLAQVEGVPDAAALAALARGVTLNDGPTRPPRSAIRRCGWFAGGSGGGRLGFWGWGNGGRLDWVSSTNFELPTLCDSSASLHNDALHGERFKDV